MHKWNHRGRYCHWQVLFQDLPALALTTKGGKCLWKACLVFVCMFNFLYFVGRLFVCKSAVIYVNWTLGVLIITCLYLTFNVVVVGLGTYTKHCECLP